MANLGSTDLDVSRLCLGGNVFGWTADREASFAVLDAYAAAGGDFIDTADTYMRPNMGISETIIGEWMAARGNRDALVIATKVGSEGGLSAANIAAHAENSLRRLQTDRIDLYYAHKDDPGVAVEETLRAFDALVRAGKVRYVAASNLSGARLVESLDTSAREGLAPYVALQPHYNLVERAGYEREYAPIAAERGLAVLPYYALAKGFLTGKYRTGPEDADSPRAAGAAAYLDESGRAVLAALDAIAGERGTTVAAVALAWLAAQPQVVAPIASARNVEQLAALLPALELSLTAGELARLGAASA
jgi:aryl-alcohol dehydrogenase-like predicted oxidoreductase